MAHTENPNFKRNILYTWNNNMGVPHFARWSYSHNFITPSDFSKQLMLHHRSMMQHPNETMTGAKRRGRDAQSPGQTIPSRATSMTLCWRWTSGIIFSFGGTMKHETRFADSMRNGPMYRAYWGESQQSRHGKHLPEKCVSWEAWWNVVVMFFFAPQKRELIILVY